MITASHEMRGFVFEFTPPPTLADVLDWRIWIQTMGSGAFDDVIYAQLTAALQWATKWLLPEWTVDELDSAIGELVPVEDYRAAVVELCNAIAASAELPREVADDVAALLDKRNEVPREWKPEGLCSCPRCRRGMTVAGIPCELDDYDPRALFAIAAMDDVDPNVRPYIAQVRGIISHSQARKIAYDRQKEEEDAEYRKIMKDKGVFRG